jgi:hypothetical protein
MWFFVFGLPGAFAQWCDTVTAELAKRAFGSSELVHADSLEQFALCAITTGASRGVVSSRHPSGGLRTALVANGRTFVVAHEDPRMALIDLVLGQGIGLADATQAVASGCAALSGFGSAPGALVLQSDRDWPQAAATVAAIADHLQIGVDDREIGGLVANLAAGDATQSRHGAVAWWSGLTASDRDMVSGALAPFIEHQANGDPPSVTWTRDLFFNGDRPNERATGPLDITGRARCLLHGPDIILPPGSWSLSLTMQFSREAAEHEFLVEICTENPLASGTIRPQQEGSAGVTVDFALGDSAEHPIAIRVSSLRAAFDGAITMVGATLVRATSGADAPPAGLVIAGT